MLFRIQMKYVIVFLGLFFLTACGSLKKTQSNNPPDGPDGLKGNLGRAVVDSTSVLEIMNFLASDDLKGRDSGSEGIEKAAEFIEGIFVQNGLKPHFATFKDTLANFQKPAYNIVAF